jgi:hypothetical protein
MGPADPDVAQPARVTDGDVAGLAHPVQGPEGVELELEIRE